MMMRRAAWLSVIVAGLGLVSPEVRACPLCKEAVAAQDDMNAVGGKPTTFMKNGYNYSVLFMMAMPFVLLGTGTFLFARAVKKGSLPEL